MRDQNQCVRLCGTAVPDCIRATRYTCDIKAVEIAARTSGGRKGGRPGMVFEEATPTTPKPAEPHGTQEMRRT